MDIRVAGDVTSGESGIDADALEMKPRGMRGGDVERREQSEARYGGI